MPWKILQCTGQPLQQRIIWTKMSVVPQLRDPVVKRVFKFFLMELPKCVLRDLWVFSWDTLSVPVRKEAIKQPHSKRAFFLPSQTLRVLPFLLQRRAFEETLPSSKSFLSPRLISRILRIAQHSQVMVHFGMLIFSMLIFTQSLYLILALGFFFFIYRLFF